LILIPVLLISIGILLISIIVNQYRIEKRQMQVLIRVRSSGMKDISNHIKRFQRSLIVEEDIENNWSNSFNEDLNAVIDLQTEHPSSGYSKSHDTRHIKYRKFRKRYNQYVIRVILYLSPLLAINIWDWISTKNSTKVIYNRMDQLQYAYYISNRVTATYATFPILFFTNNTLPIERKTAFQALVDGAKETRAIQGEIFTKFQEVDGSYNPKIKSVLFENNPTCAGFAANNLIQCRNFVKIGQPNHLQSTITVFESLISSKIQSYLDIRNSTLLPQIIDTAFINFGTLLPSFVVISAESQIIASVVDETLSDKILETRDCRLLIFIMFSLTMPVAGLLIWFHILKNIREVYNDFKKVLQIFPPGLILSSYLLKKFLLATSNQSDFIF